MAHNRLHLKSQSVIFFLTLPIQDGILSVSPETLIDVEVIRSLLYNLGFLICTEKGVLVPTTAIADFKLGSLTDMSKI